MTETILNTTSGERWTGAHLDDIGTKMRRIVVIRGGDLAIVGPQLTKEQITTIVPDLPDFTLRVKKY